MMIRKLGRIIGCMLTFSLTVVSVQAQAVFVNPDPSSYANDIGTKYFSPNSAALVLEASDLGELLGAGSRFGFYFEGTDVSNPTNLIDIFDATDSTGNLAYIDFGIRGVFDLDAGIVQSSFSGFGNIGFFLGLNPLLAGGTGIFLFTDPTLNPGGIDVASVFAQLTAPENVFIGFSVPGVAVPLSFHVVAGVHPVPEPSLLALFAIAVFGWGISHRLAYRHRY